MPRGQEKFVDTVVAEFFEVCKDCHRDAFAPKHLVAFPNRRACACVYGLQQLKYYADVHFLKNLETAMRTALLGYAILFVSNALAQSQQLELPRLHEYSSSLASAGQPTRAQFSEISKAGYEVVINLSPTNLPGTIRDEKKIVEGMGMKYVHIPVDWDKPQLDDASRFLANMSESKGKKILIHCWVNARSSAFAYLVRTLQDGEPEAHERETLTKIWNGNRGYELRNMPQWIQFLDEAKLRLAK